MKYNIAKCKTMHIGNGSIEYDNSMRGRQLNVVKTEKDLGVLMPSNLRWQNTAVRLIARQTECCGYSRGH